MPEIPRDPRQLARDILSGKISVEDLAREQQRRRAAAAGGAGAQPMARGPVPAAPQNRVPLPNLTTPPAQRPVVRPAPGRPPVSQPRPGPVVRVPPPQQRGKGPVFSRPAAAAMPVAKPVPMQAEPMAAKAYAAPKAIEDAERPRVSGRRLDVRTLARDRTRLRESILMAEVLGKPLALREEF